MEDFRKCGAGYCLENTNIQGYIDDLVTIGLNPGFKDLGAKFGDLTRRFKKNNVNNYPPLNEIPAGDIDLF